jgi:hypothetical protein
MFGGSDITKANLVGICLAGCMATILFAVVLL